MIIFPLGRAVPPNCVSVWGGPTPCQTLLHPTPNNPLELLGGGGVPPRLRPPLRWLRRRRTCWTGWRTPGPPCQSGGEGVCPGNGMWMERGTEAFIGGVQLVFFQQGMEGMGRRRRYPPAIVRCSAIVRCNIQTHKACVAGRRSLPLLSRGASGKTSPEGRGVWGSTFSSRPTPSGCFPPALTSGYPIPLHSLLPQHTCMRALCLHPRRGNAVSGGPCGR